MSKPKSLSITKLRALAYVNNNVGGALDGCALLRAPTADALARDGLLARVRDNPLAEFRRWRLTEDGVAQLALARKRCRWCGKELPVRPAARFCAMGGGHAFCEPAVR